MPEPNSIQPITEEELERQRRTVTAFPGSADTLLIDHMPYRCTNRFRWHAAPDAPAPALEQCYVCLGTGPDVWLPVPSELPDAA